MAKVIYDVWDIGAAMKRRRAERERAASASENFAKQTAKYAEICKKIAKAIRINNLC